MKINGFLRGLSILGLISSGYAMESAGGQCPQFSDDTMRDNFLLAVGAAKQVGGGLSSSLPVEDRFSFSFEGKTWFIERGFYEQIKPQINAAKARHMGMSEAGKFSPLVQVIAFEKTEKEGRKNRCFYKMTIGNAYLDAADIKIIDFRMTFLD